MISNPAAADVSYSSPGAGTQQAAIRMFVADSSNTRSARLGRLVPAAETQGKDRSVADSFIGDEARRGRLVATKNVTVTAVDLPGDAGTLRAAFIGVPQRVEFLAQPPDPDDPDKVGGFGIIAVDDAQSDDKVQESIGLGSDAASTSGMTSQGGACRTVWWDNPFSGNDNKLVTCYEKFKNAGIRNWVYNRWALADTAVGNITDFTIRSRPWSGTEGRVDTLDNWAPKPSQSCSSSGSATLGYGGASVTIPFMYCSSAIEIYPNSGDNSMGVGWYGYSSAQRQLDFAIAVRTYTSSQVLSYADYYTSLILVLGCSPTLPASPYLDRDQAVSTEAPDLECPAVPTTRCAVVKVDGHPYREGYSRRLKNGGLSGVSGCDDGPSSLGESSYYNQIPEQENGPPPCIIRQGSPGLRYKR